MKKSSSSGSCLCGKVSFSAAFPSLWAAHCHCTRCQRAHGAAFVTWVGFPSAQVEIAGVSDLRWFVASEGGSRGFCAVCGSPMFFKSDRWPGELHVARASFRDPVDREPQAHVFFETRVPWNLVADSLPKKPSVT
ncbi:GFA family protein [Dokdonella sp.]|uniref:GFA family protein n=1 Tax=Dokdonella sp. TaxID=2291710 RepID=UPI0035299455